MDKSSIEEMTEKFVSKANSIYGTNIKIKVDYFSGINCFGMACLDTDTVSYNEKWFPSLPISMVEDVVIHEVSHIFADKLFPNMKQNHGPEWKGVCFSLGGSTSTKMSLPKNLSYLRKTKNTKKFVYSCECSGYSFHEMSSVAHKKMSSGIKYICRTCRSKLFFVYQK